MIETDILPEDIPCVGEMPVLGLGTWQNDDPRQCAKSVKNALELGYRHIDTAQAYGNESAVGEGLADADVSREEVFLATKVETGSLAYGDVLETTDESIVRLGVDYIDLLYIHWPAHSYDPEDTLMAFDELFDRGKICHIGVSNFTEDHIEEARDILSAPVFANQIEMHPLLQQEGMREYAGENEIYLVAYSPLVRGKVFDVSKISEIAEKHDVSEAQVSLAWLREKGITAIPKATSMDHISDNWRSLNLELDEEDIDKIDSIDREERLIDPDFAPDSW